MTPLRIATRGSALARWQANHVAELLAPHAVEIVIVRTEGDRNDTASLQQIGGLGVFTKEVQLAVLRNEADCAVHSLKDLPTGTTSELTLAAVPRRGPVSDVLVSRRFARCDDLPIGARIATGSARRRAMLMYHRPDLQLVDIRGNVDSRLRKLDDEPLDGLILAEAGLVRLNLADRIAERLDTTWMVPAVGQGALGIECRSDDEKTLALLQRLNHMPTYHAVNAERAFLHALGGGCQVPIGANAIVAEDQLTLTGCVLNLNGTHCKSSSRTGPASQATDIGQALAADLPIYST